MTRYARNPFDISDALGGNPLAASDPIGDGALSDTQELPKLNLSSGDIDGSIERVKSKHGPVYITRGNHVSTAHSDKRLGQTRAMPKEAKTGELWGRFLEALGDLSQPKSINQTLLGKILNVGQSHVSEIKRDEKNPSIDVARRMAAYAEMCVEYLLTGKGPRRPWGEVDSEFKKLVEWWEVLDDPHRKELLSIAEAFFAKQGRSRGKTKIHNVEDTSTRLRKRSPH